MGHRKFFYLLLATLCLAAASGSIGLLRPVAVERVERIALSLHNDTLPTPGEQEQIVLVLAEEPTFLELGRWPWSRKHHAQLLGKLGLARAVLLDIVMPEASTPDADALLAAVVKAMGNVVVACHLANDPSGQERLIYPYPALLDAAAKVGITNVNPDVDGYMRSIRPIWEIEGQALASFPMAALSLLADTPPSLHPADHGYALHVDGRQLPLDDFGNLWVQTGTDAIRRYEYRDVLNGTIPPETFRDKIVVVGVAASGAADFHLVADRFSAEEMPGAEFNAKALSSMLFGNPPARLSPLVSALLAVVLALAGGLLGTRRPALAYPGVVVAGTLFFLGVHALFVTQARWADSAWPLMAMAGTFLVVQGLRYFFLHQDWELQTFSLNKIVNMNPQTIGQFKEFDELLNSAWPDIAGNTGVHLVNASVTTDELDEHFLGKTDEQLAVVRPGPQGFKDGLALPVPHGDRGTRYVLLGWDRPVGMETLQPLAAVILSTAWFFSHMKEAADSKAMLFRTIRSVFRALDFRDPITGGHSNRVSSLALEIMAHMRLKDVKQVEDIYLGALVHDVGKIGIPDSMLQKEGKLTAEEFCFIKTHPEIGMEIMQSVGLPEESLRTMAEHHERFDGSGYPARLSGKEISLGGRITAVADVFDALTNDRPYRVGWPEKRACDYILGMRGVQFDPDVVDAFIDLKNQTGKS